jgi:hypothetical protein
MIGRLIPVDGYYLRPATTCSDQGRWRHVDEGPARVIDLHGELSTYFKDRLEDQIKKVTRGQIKTYIHACKGQAMITSTNSARLQLAPQHRHAAANLDYTAQLRLAPQRQCATADLNYSAGLQLALQHRRVVATASTTQLNFSSCRSMDVL